MDEAERCHRLVYISFGKVLTAGTAPKSCNARDSHVVGCRRALAPVLDAVEQGGWMAVPFGTSLHVSSGERDDFPRWLADEHPALASQVRIEPIPTGLEDVFIALTRDVRDPVR